MDLVAGEVQLEGRDTGQGSGRGADFRRIVGKGADVIPKQGRRRGELRAGQLHAVAGVAGEADGDALQFLDRWGGMLFGFCGHALAGSWYAARPTIPWAALGSV